MTTAVDTDTITKELAGVLDGFWYVIVYNDDVTTFDTVERALVELFAHTPQAAHALAMRIHTHGKAIVAMCSHAEALKGQSGLQARKILCTIEEAGK
jgi:ATP-dependent Clp protease adapter protein ClpS